jgi:hypothetical protein
MKKTAYSMNDSFGVEVVQTVKDLSSEGLCYILVEPTAVT